MKKLFLVALICLATIASVSAQPGDPGGDPDVPITGIEILLGLGGALGIRHLTKRKNKTE